MVHYCIYAAISAVSAVLLTWMGCKILQILQLSSYRVKGVGAWLKKTKYDYLLRYFSAAFFATVCMLIYVGCFGKYKIAAPFGLVFYLVHTVAFIVITARQKNKTPLKCTPRIVRLCILSAVLFGGATFGLLVAGDYMPVKYSLIGVLPLAVPFIVIAAHCILLPFEALNNRRYERKARKKLQSMPKLIRIGITGSYGKTTAKNMLAAMLQADFSVCATPKSYNTPMGIARTVNYELTPAHTVFIAEMGARYRGDIARLARLVRPDIGVLTAIGNQHLETFGTLQAISDTKYELIEGLRDGGVGVFSSDNEGTRALYDRTAGDKLCAGKTGDVTYRDVQCAPEGTTFTLVYGDKSVSIHTRLLGSHIPSLISLCAAVAVRLGVSLDTICAAAENLPQVEHRLQVIQNGDVTVLDDSYNGNAAGAKAALEVLRSFPGTRMVITPGLVELGEQQQSANTALGSQVFGAADYAYFVGPNAAWLQAGAVAAGMDAGHICICDTLDEAVRRATEISGKKSILFSNDLPDNF